MNTATKLSPADLIAGPRFLSNLSAAKRRLELRPRPKVLEAQKIFRELSPGSCFVASECGRHLAWENLLVSIEGRNLIVVAAYFVDDMGKKCVALVNRNLFSHAPVLDLGKIARWEEPICSLDYVPEGLGTSLGGVVGWTREWVQTSAARGWNLSTSALGSREIPAVSAGHNCLY